MLLRYGYKWTTLPTSVDWYKKATTLAKSQLFPFWAYGIEFLTQRKRDFTPIAEKSALILGTPTEKAYWVLQNISYMGERLVPLTRLLERIPGWEGQYEKQRRQVIKEWREGIPFIARLMENMIFLYIRNTKDVRKTSHAKELLRLLKREAREATRTQKGKLSLREMKNYEDRSKRIYDVILDLTEEKEEPIRAVKPGGYKVDLDKILKGK